MTRKSGLEKPALDIVEEAIHLLRTAPAGALVRYYIGSIPFVLGLLFFWADMSRSAYASSRCAGASFFLALLFIWMKCWQAGATQALWRHLGGQAVPRWDRRRIARLVITQTLLQPASLVLVPLALLATLPFPWVYGFFQNAIVFGMDERKGADEVARRAWKQAKLWPKQHCLMLSHLFLFGFFVFFNVTIGMILLPQLLKMFLGIESHFTRSPHAFLNTTFVATAFSLTYLCLDPLVKAAYTLRCFHGESLQTGESLWADLHRLQRTGTLVILFALAGLAASLPGPGRAAAPQPAPSVSAAELNQSIRETIKHPRYSWRMPREGVAREEQAGDSILQTVVEYIGGKIKGVFKAIGRSIEKFFDWLGKWLVRNQSDKAPVNIDAIFTTTQVLLYSLVGLVVVTLAIFLYRIWRNRPVGLVVAEAVAQSATVPDLNDEHVAADQLPVDGWLKLAQELAAQGEPRLALRALYLACLAALAEREWIRIRKSKSNRDYTRELARRAHTRPGIEETFAQAVMVFERSWYGRHEVTPEGLDWFQAHYERIKTLVQ